MFGCLVCLVLMFGCLEVRKVLSARSTAMGRRIMIIIVVIVIILIIIVVIILTITMIILILTIIVLIITLIIIPGR